MQKEDAGFKIRNATSLLLHSESAFSPNKNKNCRISRPSNKRYCSHFSSQRSQK
ncbi:MAG: hypothetical protein J0G96_15110 [Flavobacteriia bacterium]|nr:hypothetical protein [Flavobacteriia bacterium]